MSDLTWEELAYRLHYNPETGEFTWVNPAANCLSPGDIAGGFNSQGYIYIRINRYKYRANCLAWLYMKGEWPNGEVDHINLDKSDNRWQNLRIAEDNSNCWNQTVRKNNTSGEKGVSWHEVGGFWQARVMKNYITYGSKHNYWWQAVRAVRRMREKLHGEYYRHK